MPDMQTRLLVPLLSLVLGTAVGYFVGQSRNPMENKAVAAGTSLEAQQGADSSASAAAASAAAKTKEDESKKSQDEAESRFLQLDELVDSYSPKRAAKLMEGWSLEQIQAGLAYLAGKAKSYEVHGVKGELFRAWARIDTQAAWKAALALADNEGKSTCLGTVAGEVAKSSPESAVQMAMGLGMGSDRANVLRQIFQDWGKVNMKAAIAYWNTHPDLPVDDYAIGTSLYTLARDNPEAAAAQAMSLMSDGSRRFALSSALNSWSTKDLPGALKWAQSITDPLRRDEALSALTQSGAMTNPKAMLDVLSQIGSPEVKREARRNLLYNWMSKDPAGALDYLLSQSADQMDQDLSWGISNGLQNLTPQERDTLLARLPEGKSKNQILGNMASNSIYNGRYAQAVSALNSMPDSPDRDNYLHNLGQQWGKKDPQSAASWINAQQDSSDRDMVVAGYATAVAGRDPQAALQWAASIPDKSVQATAYKNIVGRWYDVDAKAAQAWLNTTPLFTPEERKRMLADAPGRSNSTYVPKVTNRR